MATWNITVPAGSGIGGGTSGSNTSDVSGSRPGDFDGATINSVTLSGAGNVTLNAVSSNDTIGIRWNIETSGGVNTYGGVGSDAASIAYCPVTAFSSLPAAIAAGGTPSPAPTTATAADWHQVAWDWTYTVSGKDDASTCDWASFTIVVDYTPAGSGVTRTPDPGSLALTGLVPTRSIDPLPISITPGTGSLSLSGLKPASVKNPPLYGMVLQGYQPSVTNTSDGGVTRIPDSGSLALTGLAPAVDRTANVFIEPGTGALVVTGLQVTADRTDNQFIEPATGSVVIAGIAPTVDRTANAFIEPGTGALVITGIAPTVERTDNKAITPDTVNVVITGIAPTVNQTRNIVITVPTGALTVTGVGPTVERTDNQEASVPTGAVVIQGLLPTVEQTANQSRAPPTGALSLVGLEPSVTRTDNRIINPGSGSITTQGYAPGVTDSGSGNTNIQPNSGSLTLTGLAPTVQQPVAVSPDTGSLVVSGLVPTISQPVSVNPSTGALVLAGYQPTVTDSGAGGTTINPSTGALTVTGLKPATVNQPNNVGLQLVGYAPTVSVDAVSSPSINPASGGLTLQGYAPTVTNSGDTNKTITPATGSLTLTGNPSSLEIVIFNAPSSLYFTGYRPTASVVALSPVITCPPGSLTLQGHAPICINTSDVRKTGGRSGKRGRKRYYVTVDGQTLVAYSQQEVFDLLETAAKTVEAQPERIEKRPIITIRTGAGKPIQAKKVQDALLATQKRVNKAYDQRQAELRRQRAIDTEISRLLITKFEAEDADEEEAVIALLLS